MEGITFEYDAELLGVKKSTVQTHFKGQKKIEQCKNETFFLLREKGSFLSYKRRINERNL
jgi:hypothetical protein